MKRVLLVDDRQDNLYLLRQLLQSQGFEVQESVNGADALQKLERHKFALIISDIMMPTMDGFELCHIVKTTPRLKDIPFIFYTATYTDQKDEALGLSLGANAFIVKPTEPDEFLRRITEVLSRPAQTELLDRIPLEEAAFLKQYNERLVRKIEDKLVELERKNIELEELTRTLEERVQMAVKDLTERNRELEAFASSVSHDLRSPLRGIRGRADLLMEEAGKTLPVEYRAHLQNIIDTAERMDALIQGLLQYSKLSTEQIQLQPVSLEETIDRATEQLSARIEETKAHIQMQKPLPSVRGHGPALVQVFANLLDNAIKFVAPGKAPRIDVSANEKNGRVCVNVRDNGIGIEPRYQARIFEMFERAGTNASGFGIGLAIVRKAVERMGGGVTVQSQPGEGSSFVIELARA